MISTNDFKAGVVIKFKGSLQQVLWYQHVKMQQRAPIVRTKLLNMQSGNVIEQAFRSGEKFEDVFLERKQLQYLYSDGDFYHFMDTSDYENITVEKRIIGKKKDFLKENDEVTAVYGDNTLIAIDLPAAVTLKVTETNPGLRGDTAKAGTKAAKVETGATVRVPLFVNPDDLIRVDTRSGEYLERA